MIVGTAKRHKETDKQNPTRYYSSRQEKDVAQAVNGRQTSNSGATMFGGKGDVLTSGRNGFIIECKTRTKSSASITIQKEWFNKLKEEALLTGTPHHAVVFNFGPNEENHYIIDEYLFNALQQYLSTLDDSI